MSWTPKRLTRTQLEERRFHCAPCLTPGEGHYRQVCQQYRISPSTFYRWRKRFLQSGLEGLKARVATGRPRQLSAEQENQLKGLLQQDATQHGFADITWTTQRVRDLIGLKYGIWYHPDHVHKVLSRMGFSYQKPDKRAIERNEQKIQAWIADVVTEIQKRVLAGATVAFLDESGFSLKTTTRRTWALKGQTPLVKTRMNWEKLSVIGAVTSGGKFFQNTTLGSFKGSGVARFLKHLLDHISGELIVVLDNGAIHKTAEVKAVLAAHSRLTLQFLPPYAPELNPIEHIWAHVKQNILGNALSRTLDELKKKLQRAWQRLRRLKLSAYTCSGVWRPSQSEMEGVQDIKN